MSEWSSMSLDMPDAKERRRYALLQAAATIFASHPFQAAASDRGLHEDSLMTLACKMAAMLIYTIEKQETAK